MSILKLQILKLLEFLRWKGYKVNDVGQATPRDTSNRIRCKVECPVTSLEDEMDDYRQIAAFTTLPRKDRNRSKCSNSTPIKPKGNNCNNNTNIMIRILMFNGNMVSFEILDCYR